jgi:hypothetical protein
MKHSLNADTARVSRALQGAAAILINQSNISTLYSGSQVSGGFTVVHKDSIFNVKVVVDDPEGQVTLHQQQVALNNLECGAASLTGSALEGFTLAACVNAMLNAGTLNE